MDCCRFVNVFQGCGEVDLPHPEGLAARWFFIKAGCGNTSPAAALPFSRITAAPFSGGYPTGYGNHLPNSHSHPPKFEEGKGLIGFSHLQQSGTGAIGYYYNYAVVTPRFRGTPMRVTPTYEKAEPGYYCTELNTIRCELTVTDRLALHRYTFSDEGGEITVDFSNNGLNMPNHKQKTVSELVVYTENGTAFASAVIEGITVYFAVKSKDGSFFTDSTNRAVLTLGKKTSAELSVAVSIRSMEQAAKDLCSENDFDTARKNAYERWNDILSRIQIETEDDDIREIFYSNLYHSLVKPSNWYGESFIYSGDGPFMLDFSTLWDMYKTALPLIFLICRDEGEQICETLLKVGEKLGFLPNSFGLNANLTESAQQARMLGAYVLLTAYRFGIIKDAHRMLSVIKSDLLDENKKDFTEHGHCESNTWVLDMADACAYAGQVAEKIGDTQTAELFKTNALKWKGAYDKKTGLLSKRSSYYEGTHFNYSFRQTADMEGRIALAGGNERFVSLLDDFFGYNKPAVTLPTDPFNYKPVDKGMKLGRFEGFNNESDMEAPYSYIYAGRQDKTCEVMRSGMKYMFTSGRGGLPGNNDTGALSSYYVWSAFGLFPVSGSDTILIGSPFVKSAKIKLSSGRELNITVNNSGVKNIYVKKVMFCGREITDFRISASELMSGGELVFDMCGSL